MNYVHPFMLPDGTEEAMDEVLLPYDSTLAAGDQYVEGDLVTMDPTDTPPACKKWTTAAANSKLALVGQKFSQPFAKQYFLDFGVPVNIVEQENYFVFSYQDATADGSDHAATAANIAAIQAGEIRDLGYNATEGCITIRDSSGTANTPQVKMIRVYKGAAGDNNIQVLARILPDWLMGA